VVAGEVESTWAANQFADDTDEHTAPVLEPSGVLASELFLEQTESGPPQGGPLHS
jgi:hypothetical protein